MRPRVATASIWPLIWMCEAPIPTATTDSPRATITTSPCRSTKCPILIQPASSGTIAGTTAKIATATTQSTYSAAPPMIVPTRMRTPASRFIRAKLQTPETVQLADCM